MTHYNGLTVLLTLIQKNPDEKFITKIAFLLSALCRQYPEVKSKRIVLISLVYLLKDLFVVLDELLSLGYLRCLISLMCKERSESHEHVLSLMVDLIENNPDATIECQKSNNNFKEIIQRHMSKVRNKEEHQVQ